MSKKRVIVLLLCMAAFLGYIGLNKQGTILLDGKEITTYKVWGKEYILVDDLLRTNYEIQMIDSVLTISTSGTSDYQENPKAIPQINDLHIVVNGSQIDFKLLNGSYALDLNDLCNRTDEDVMELNHEMPIGLASHIDAYYSTFNKLGYSPYRFKMNEDGSIESLHAGSIVESDMGKIEVDQVCEFVSKTEMQHYFSCTDRVFVDIIIFRIGVICHMIENTLHKLLIIPGIVRPIIPPAVLITHSLQVTVYVILGAYIRFL